MLVCKNSYLYVKTLCTRCYETTPYCKFYQLVVSLSDCQTQYVSLDMQQEVCRSLVLLPSGDAALYTVSTRTRLSHTLLRHPKQHPPFLRTVPWADFETGQPRATNG
jgi:hypothetical protein